MNKRNIFTLLLLLFFFVLLQSKSQYAKYVLAKIDKCDKEQYAKKLDV
jgi:hypothetical protein